MIALLVSLAVVGWVTALIALIVRAEAAGDKVRKTPWTRPTPAVLAERRRWVAALLGWLVLGLWVLILGLSALPDDCAVRADPVIIGGHVYAGACLAHTTTTER